MVIFTYYLLHGVVMALCGMIVIRKDYCMKSDSNGHSYLGTVEDVAEREKDFYISFRGNDGASAAIGIPKSETNMVKESLGCAGKRIEVRVDNSHKIESIKLGNEIVLTRATRHKRTRRDNLRREMQQALSDNEREQRRRHSMYLMNKVWKPL